MKKIYLVSKTIENDFNKMANELIEGGFIPNFDTFKVIALDNGNWAHSIILQKEVEDKS